MSGAFKIALVVEGQGDEAAAPIVVRRIAQSVDETRYTHVVATYRVPRGKITKEGELERYVELAAREVGADGAILVLIDSDEDCAATLGPALLQRAKQQRAATPVGVVLAVCEFEAWFLASARSLAGERGLRPDLEPPDAPEAIRGAKGWLQRNRTDGRAYSETIDQPALAALFDMTTARTGAPSFDKMWREIEALMGATDPAPEGAEAPA